MACSARCRRSTSPKADCRCSCGGQNHGVEVANPPVSAAGGPSGGSGGGIGDPEVRPASPRPLSGYGAGSAEARERFGTREGSRGGEYSQVDLVAMRASQEGRPFTPQEERFVREGVAAAGFDPGTTAVPQKWDGANYRGRTLRQGEEMTNTEVHDYRHVIETRQWPEGTTTAGYVSSARDVVLDPEGRILYSRRGDPPNDRKHLAFARRSGGLRGPEGDEYVWVEYRLETGHWMTAHQRPDPPEETASKPNRKDSRWMNAQG